MFNSEEFLNFLKSKDIEFYKPNLQIGGNSYFYRFNFKGKDLILKVYKRGDKGRVEEAKTREVTAYNFLKNKFANLPQLYVGFEIEDGICLEFLEGVRPKMNRQTNIRILESFVSLQSIYANDQSFQNAKDASFNTGEVLDQIEKRITTIGAAQPKKACALERVTEELSSRAEASFPESSITYSFSDVGPHNVIKREEEFFFIDLEFFGRDSAVKMFADYLLHPKNKLSAVEKHRALLNAERYFGIKEELIFRAIPFFAAKWATIIARRIGLSSNENNSVDLEQEFVRYIRIASLKTSSEIRDRLKMAN